MSRISSEGESFFNGLKIMLPFTFTIILTVGGWGYSAYMFTKKRGADEEKLRVQAATIATIIREQDAQIKRINEHDVVLATLQVQLDRIEKIGDETNKLLTVFLQKNGEP